MREYEGLLGNASLSWFQILW